MIQKNGICFLGAWIDACSLWRLYMPHLNYPGSSFFCFANNPDFNLISAHEIVVVQRCCTEQQFHFIQLMPKLGIKVIYDLDDDIWDIPKFNPAERVLAPHKQGFMACIRIVDMVTVSTHFLAKAVRANVRNMVHAQTGKPIPIVVAENKIDERMFAAPVRNERLTIGWAGSSSHIGDLAIVESAILDLAPRCPDVLFEFRGCDPPESITKLVNFRWKTWMPVAEYGARMPLWGWHIALAPLVDHSFNDAKSCIKAVEAAYCRTPCLASWTRPYDEFCSHDPELRWLLCAGQGNWAPKLRELINDGARREELGQRAHAVMRKHYSWQSGQHEGWEQALATVRTL
jgi:O-antigen biosynthesis protein